MVLRPLRRAPMMLGGVGFQVGLDEARRKREREARPAPPPGPDVIGQLKGLQELRDGGVLTPDEFERLKRRVLSASRG